MTEVICLAEQEASPAIGLLRAVATVVGQPVAELLQSGWAQPLIVLGDVLRQAEAARLIKCTYRNSAPLLIMPSLPTGDVTTLLDAPAPVNVVRRQAERVDLADESLRAVLGRDELQILCSEAIETALRTGVLATAEGRPVIWAYQPTRAATSVVWVTPQLLLVSARTDPLDREELLAALLTWAHDHIRTPGPGQAAPSARAEARAADPALVRALVIAWSVQPDLTRQTLAGWLREHLFVKVKSTDLDMALDALREEGALNEQGRPQAGRIAELADEWRLRAWVREARREHGFLGWTDRGTRR